MGNTGSGGAGKNRHASGDDAAPTLTARYAESDFYEHGAPHRRQRASTLTHGHGLTHVPTSQRLLPTVFKWEGGGKEVYITGSFNNWKSKIPLARSHGDFFTIIDLPEGDHQYKFYVDGQWMNSNTEPVTSSEIGTQNNTMSVKRSDFDAFEALAIDGRASKKGKEAEYGQDVPVRDNPDVKPLVGPPILPPHLLQVILNKDIPAHVEPSLLPEPNHVMLNHMYALSIKEGVMTLSATHRFRKKYVTTLLYKPMPEKVPDPVE